MKKKLRVGAAMKVVRRIHMYLGLLMYPWVLLYGLSGMLFNHPQIGRDMQRTPIPPEQLTELTGFTPWQAQAMAEAVVAALNGAGDGRYRLEGEASLTGFPIFHSKREDGGRNVMIMSLTAGRAGVAIRPAPPAHEQAPFAGPVDVPEYTMGAVADRLEGLLPALGIEGPPLKPHWKAAPELRMTVNDGQRSWNAIYNVRTGKIEGRPTEGPSHVPFVELLGKLHKQHHFPVHMGVSAFWALLADLTGLCLLLWALSGLAMWWQIRPSRRWGAIVIGVSLVLATALMSGMTSELTFLAPPGGDGP